MSQGNRVGFVRRALGATALTILVVACSGSSDDAAPEESTPTSEDPAGPVTDATSTSEPVATDPPVEEAPVTEAPEIPDLPCADYVEESGFPLVPCDSGVLVETLQRDLESLFASITIDGLFGNQTFDFVKQFQSSNGMEATGIVSEALAAEIATADPLGGSGADAPSDSAPADAAPTDSVADEDAGADQGSLEQLCNGLIGKPDDPNFTAQQVEECSGIGIDIVGEG